MSFCKNLIFFDSVVEAQLIFSVMFFYGLLVYLVVFTLVGYLIAKYIGSKRQIGFRISLFFSIILTPVFGLLVTLLTKSSKKPAPNKSTLKKIIGWVFVLWGVFLFAHLEPNIHAVRNASTLNYIAVLMIRLMVALGTLSYGTYLVGRANGRRYDNDEVSLKDMFKISR